MVTETVNVEIPKEILDLATRSGISRDKISKLLRSFAVLEVVASTSKLTKRDAEKLSREIKVAAWKRLNPYRH
jgi:hypothetical protein